MTSTLANMKKFISLILFILLLSGTAFAGGTIQWPTACFFDSNGDPLSGGLLNSYVAGTSTRKALYSDRAATTAHTNPEVLDANGCTEVYGIGTYKLVLTNASGSETIFTDDNVKVSTDPSDSYFYPNYSAADQGATGNSDTIKYAIDTCSTKKCTIVLQHNSGGADTTYILGTSDTAGSNVFFKFEPGAQIQPAAGVSLTVYSPEHVLASPRQQIIDATNNSINPLMFSVGGVIYPGWWGAVADGATDCLSAFNQAIASVGILFSKLFVPPGHYLFSDTLTFTNELNGFVFDAQGTQFTFSHATNDFIVFTGFVKSKIKLGTILTNGTGAAFAIIPGASGASYNEITWRELRGTTRQGTGIKILVTNAGESVSTFIGGPIHAFEIGVSVVTTGVSPIDTNTYAINFIYDCDKSVYVNGSGGVTVNSQTWRVNLEASASGDIGLQTNEKFGIYELTVLGVAGGTVVQLDADAEQNQFIITPPESSFSGATFITDNSTYPTNTFNGKRDKVVTAYNTVGDETYNAGAMVGGIITRSGPTGAYNDTTASATNIIKHLPGVMIGKTFELVIRNEVGFINTIVAGTGITLAGTTDIAANTWRKFVGTVTDVTTPAVSFRGVGSGTL